MTSLHPEKKDQTICSVVNADRMLNTYWLFGSGLPGLIEVARKKVA
jgi:hypothetical protein